MKSTSDSKKKLSSVFMTVRSADGGQAIVEFTFCMIVIVLLIYGLIKSFMWAGTDLAERRVRHDSTLMTPLPTEYWTGASPDDPGKLQLNPNFYQSKRMKTVFNAW